MEKPAGVYTKQVRECSEREQSDGMDMADVRKLFRGELNPEEYYTFEVIEFESVWGAQHAGVLENFAANILHGTHVARQRERTLAALRVGA